MPNNLIDNATYLANDAVPDILKALCKTHFIYSIVILFLCCCHHLLQLFFHNVIDIPDPDNVLADQLTEKYFKGAEMGIT